jgi:CheY-like chemotaxis protein
MTENLSSNKCQCILIVEDEEDIRENLKMLLELEGYKVSTAVNGEDGMRVLRTMERPCLILLDLLMPVMNGMEFLKEKMQEDKIAQIPVCIVSGVAEKPDMKGASGFVKKPIDLEILLKFVKNYCHPILM